MIEEPRFVESSGNVFAELGLPDAGTRLAKAELARTISTAIHEGNLTQQEAAVILDIDLPKVSAITRGRLADFSMDRLLTFVNRMGMDIEITLSTNPEPGRPPRIVVQGADEGLAASRTSIGTEVMRFD